MDNMIGQRIKNRRKQMHITQAQIKEATGISTGNLSEIENGHILPSSAALINLSKILECSVDYILFGESRILDNSSFSNIRNSIEDDLLKYYRGIPESDQEEIMMLLQLKYNRNAKSKESSHLKDANNILTETA